MGGAGAGGGGGATTLGGGETGCDERVDGGTEACKVVAGIGTGAGGIRLEASILVGGCEEDDGGGGVGSLASGMG